MIYERNKDFYFPDGDVAIVCQSTVFKVHSLLLRLASQAFDVKLSGPWLLIASTPVLDVNDQESHAIAADIRDCNYDVEFDDESPEDVHTLLSTIYPNRTQASVVTWENIAAVLRMSERYLLEAARPTCDAFLQVAFQHDPLRTLLLADRYHLSGAYKAVSATIIDALMSFRADPLFKMLTPQTRLKLYERHIDVAIRLRARALEIGLDTTPVDWDPEFGTYTCTHECLERAAEVLPGALIVEEGSLVDTYNSVVLIREMLKEPCGTIVGDRIGKFMEELCGGKMTVQYLMERYDCYITLE
ncbi:hypothetical protein BC936DRAFT_141022 [Jimgerdemannia flammicorona]|uniref:Uncharacterized protein n=2 Tax=Jimgerdemannia flammicorona TaxID=994334 RepID=A0A433DGF3_9FUNG|nr:hypothetical protein BC936DRAFT_141022 [Jimgerdemannia flammicorona]RUS20961.1 hypothetical protein BC938DRAFT_475482 [Jimgerdemannia flammicorona]